MWIVCKPNPKEYKTLKKLIGKKRCSKTYLENCWSTCVGLLFRQNTFEYENEFGLDSSLSINILIAISNGVCVKVFSDFRNFSLL